MSTQVLAVNSAAAKSAQIAIADGASAHLFLVGSTDGEAPVSAVATVQILSSSGVWISVGVLNNRNPMLHVVGPAVYRVKKSASSASFGVDQSTATPWVAPVNTLAPALGGGTHTGNTATCTSGTWTGTGIAYTYQWTRGGVAIVGATAAAYVLTVADEGAVIGCDVTATNAAGSVVASSDTVTPTP